MAGHYLWDVKVNNYKSSVQEFLINYSYSFFLYLEFHNWYHYSRQYRCRSSPSPSQYTVHHSDIFQKSDTHLELYIYMCQTMIRPTLLISI